MNLEHALRLARVDVDVSLSADAMRVLVGEIDRLRDELEALSRPEDQCCDQACNGGACEGCRCCAAGWCVTGADGLPEGAEHLELWIGVAAEHNPIVAAWQADRVELARLRSDLADLVVESRRDVIAELTSLRAQLAEVLDMHQPKPDGVDRECVCDQFWPCPTARALGVWS